jgi:hypothetical protein
MNLNRTTLRDRCRLAMAGIDKYLATETSIPIDGVARTPADIKQQLQAMVVAADATQAARAAWVSASSAERAMHEGTTGLLGFLRTFVLLKFGGAAQATLADFGFAPSKRTAPTTETKTEAVQKAQATRAARHTMGPKQKAKIKGTVTTTAPATPPTATAQAPATPTANPAAAASVPAATQPK